MMLKPSIDVLLDKVDSKYSLVVLEAKRAHELRDGEAATQKFSSVKPTLQALEELAEGNVTIHPAPEAKRTALKEKRELERLLKIEEERKIKEQIAKEQAEEEAKQRKDKVAPQAVKAPVVETVEAPIAKAVEGE
ncbi:DNA-directed RNA polymerase subunit omega [Lactococcus carnosus]|uniref:DNA-directed RNA polymerase subunit omega n=1 Tax=Pseudolactococcus carnosus TaxID=2749961 RepID=UPI000812A7F6|nr:DNA-directed RNA polymerase subunit omega [Lactococcus carnosus]SCA92596.1 DNA-directed RNA polymerase subunit omega [Lactococcus piscium]SOB48392.1 DNA-directed RNA polymerase subunit omega [Lactococcus piscium]